MRVLIYVEGPADRAALERLLRSVTREAHAQGVGIRFLPLEGKARVLRLGPLKAAEHLAEHPDDWVFVLPDLYPMGVFEGPEAHGSSPQLQELLMRRFRERAAERRLGAAAMDHFRAHCLKHDLEVLLLASPDALKQRLKTSDAMRGGWRKPVEEQNDDQPPKRVVEALFRKYVKRDYVDTTDAPWVLERASLDDVIAACPQCFAPFVDELRRILRGESVGDLSTSRLRQGNRPAARRRRKPPPRRR